MKQIISILFLSVYLLAATEVRQLLKLPIVFQHFAEHKSENKNISFLGFLKMHYLEAVKKDKDYERDMQLPFKTCCDCHSPVTNACVPSVLQLSCTNTIDLYKKTNYIVLDQFILSSYLSNIWQPPKYA